MGKLIKILLYVVGGIIVLGLAALFIVPKFIDVQKYKPMIIDKVAAATGRPVTLGGDLNVSVFPWVGLSFSDFRLGNPEGFAGKDFLVVKSFEAHVKLMPLLSKEVEIDSFVLEGPEIYLEKRKDGLANWQGLGGAAEKETAPKEETAKTESQGFGLKSIEVGEFAINNATLSYVDLQQGVKKTINGLTLQLNDVSLERPISMLFKAVIDGKTVSAQGQFGPIGPKPGEGILPVDFSVTAVDQLDVKIQGQLENLVKKLSYSLNIDVAQFSPRKLMSGLSMDFPVATSDPAALDALSLKMKAMGTIDSVAIADAVLGLDSSTFKFSGNAKSISPLNLVFEGNLDTIDLDRYLPAQKESGGKAATKTNGSAAAASKPIDYAPLRKLVLDTQLTVGELKAHGGKVENIKIHLVANKGVITLNPFSMDLYSGKVSSEATVNVQDKVPATAVTVKTTQVQVGPLLRDFAKKDVLEGALAADVALTMKGDSPEQMKKSLNGQGELVFTDGAIVGIDLAGMIRNVKASFGLAAPSAEKPRTDFAELRAPFTIKNGLVNTPGTALQSPLVRVTASGDANLVNEALDMKVEPKFVATLKGQGDTKERSGLMVPILVRGTFSSPEFSPDLTALIKEQIPDVESVKKALEEELLPKDSDGKGGKGLKGLIPKFKLK